ncbi:hypothetical protein T484DRAFT_1864006 [Baffinella frigidus]|nr:hypothetical protein T484DRAFT_1864006 [Cryptophyta sp. CCMP2293]
MRPGDDLKWTSAPLGIEVVRHHGVPDVVAFLQVTDDGNAFPGTEPTYESVDPFPGTEPTYEGVEREEAKTKRRGRDDDDDMLTVVLKKEFALGSCTVYNLSLKDWDQPCRSEVKQLIHARRMDAFDTMTALHRLSIYNMASLPTSFFMNQSDTSELLRHAGTPHPTLVCNSHRVLCLAFAVFDKFVTAGTLPESIQCTLNFDFWSPNASWLFHADKVHILRVYAAACYVVAWKMEVGNVVLASAEVYNALILCYKMEGNPRGEEPAGIYEKQVLAECGRTVMNVDGSARKVQKSRGGDMIDSAELVVLRDCDWGVHLTTQVDWIDALFEGKHNEPRWIQLRSLSYDLAVQLTINTSTVYNTRFTLARGAYLVVGEACLQLGVLFSSVPGVERAELERGATDAVEDPTVVKRICTV